MAQTLYYNCSFLLTSALICAWLACSQKAISMKDSWMYLGPSSSVSEFRPNIWGHQAASGQKRLSLLTSAQMTKDLIVQSLKIKVSSDSETQAIHMLTQIHWTWCILSCQWGKIIYYIMYVYLYVWAIIILLNIRRWLQLERNQLVGKLGVNADQHQERWLCW